MSAEIHLLATPNDPSFGSQWDMTKIQAPTGWNTTTGSLKIVVADIDSGIDYAHVDLYENVWINQAEIPAAQKANLLANYDDGDGIITFWDLNSVAIQGHWDSTTVVDSNADNRIDGRDLLASSVGGGWANGADDGTNTYVDDLVGWDFVGDDNNPFDDNGHGTHTAGTIGAIGNNAVGVAGVNWQTQIMALKILDASGSGDLFDAADAIRYANANGARVSNNSWGFYDSGETVSGAKYDYLYNAIKDTPNVLFVAAAGNNGLNNDTHWAKNFPSSYNLSNIVSVAATDSKDRKATFSNYGSTTVDLGAPGVGILSTVPGGGYASYNGTSMATPHVAGAAALILAKNAGLTTANVKTAILGGVDVVSSMSKTVSKGRLNVNKALNGVAAGSSSSSGSASSTTSTGSTGTAGSSRGPRRRADRLGEAEVGELAAVLAPVVPEFSLLPANNPVQNVDSFALPTSFASQVSIATGSMGKSNPMAGMPLLVSTGEAAELNEPGVPMEPGISDRIDQRSVSLLWNVPIPVAAMDIAANEVGFAGESSLPDSDTANNHDLAFETSEPAEVSVSKAPSAFSKLLSQAGLLVGAMAFFGYGALVAQERREEMEKADRQAR